MLKLLLCILVLLLCCSGCSDTVEGPIFKSGPPVLAATFTTIDIDDSELIRLAYSSYQLPRDFYHEDLRGGSIYYDNTLSIKPLGLRTPPFYELSTDDKGQALAWSESTSVNSAYYRDRIEDRETDRYYEFRRVYQKNPRDIILSRIHKLAYLDRSMYDFAHPTPLIGRLMIRPIEDTTVKNFAEYFWFIHNFRIAGMKALASVLKGTEDSLSCAIYSLQYADGDFEIPDHIALIRTEYAVVRSTGEIFKNSVVIRTILGRRDGSI